MDTPDLHVNIFLAPIHAQIKDFVIKGFVIVNQVSAELIVHQKPVRIIAVIMDCAQKIQNVFANQDLKELIVA